MENRITTILCSGVALGVYIPAIITDRRLVKSGINTDAVVLENLLPENLKSRINDNKKAFHSDFRVALTGQKIARDMWGMLDKSEVDGMFEIWRKEERRDFIVFSGFWMSCLREYQKRTGMEINADIVHMDADISASWKQFASESEKYNNIWLFRHDENRLVYNLGITDEDPLPFGKRNGRFVIHGGGWGMGTYLGKIPELTDAGLLLDITAYGEEEVSGSNGNHRYFMTDPGWSPWHKSRDNRHEFPPFARIKPGEKPAYENREEYHEFYDVVRNSIGNISKPGGATLLDSLSSATPLIMLDPFGDYERKNAELWKNLGFGIYYDEWKDAGYSACMLEKLHENILNARKGEDYISDYIRRYGSSRIH